MTYKWKEIRPECQRATVQFVVIWLQMASNAAVIEKTILFWKLLANETLAI